MVLFLFIAIIRASSHRTITKRKNMLTAPSQPQKEEQVWSGESTAPYLFFFLGARQRMIVLLLARGHEQIPNAYFRFQIVRMSRIILQLPSEPVDIDLEHMAFPDVISAPDMFKQEILG